MNNNREIDESIVEAPSHSLRKDDEKWAVYILAALVILFGAIGGYGFLDDDGPLQVIAFCGAMPTLLGLLVSLAMRALP